MFTPEEIKVIRRADTFDELGEPISGEATEETAFVLVAPGSTSDLDATRPNGVEVVYSLHFQKSYTQSLRGCSVVVRGETFEVIGDPKPYTPENTPGLWNRVVEVKRIDG